MNACPSSQTSTATQCTVTGLINGSSYLFAVAAINGDGTGTYSASSNEVSVSAPPANNPQSPLTITTTAGPAFNGASTSSLALGTSGGNVGGLDAYGVGDMTSSVTILNTSSNAVSGNVVLSNSSEPYAIAENPAGTDVYVANFGSNNVSVVNTLTDAVVAVIPVGTAPTDVAVNPAGTLAYVTNSQSSSVSVINLASNTVTATLSVGSDPRKVMFTPSGNQAVILTENVLSVSVVNTSNDHVSQVTTPGDPVAFALSPAGTFAYVACFINQLAVINLATDTETATVTVAPRGYAASVAVSPSGQSVYVLGDGSGSGPGTPPPGTVSVVQTSINCPTT